MLAPLMLLRLLSVLSPLGAMLCMVTASSIGCTGQSLQSVLMLRPRRFASYAHHTCMQWFHTKMYLSVDSTVPRLFSIHC